MSSATNSTLETGFGPILLKALIAGVIAAVINVILFFVGGAFVGGIDVDINQVGEFTPLPFYFPAFASIVPMLVAGVGLWIARRFIPRGNTVFVVGVAILTLLSLFSPLGSTVATTSAGIVLALMHLVAGGVMIWYLAK